MKGLTNLKSDEKIIRDTCLVCPWPECIFRSLLQFLVSIYYGSVLVSWCAKKWAYPNCSGALTNCSGRLITVPEDL